MGKYYFTERSASPDFPGPSLMLGLPEPFHCGGGTEREEFNPLERGL